MLTQPLTTHRFTRNVRVRIRLCAAHCQLCTGAHEFTEPMDAERIGYRKVRITQPDEPVWFGAVVSDGDFEMEPLNRS